MPKKSDSNHLQVVDAKFLYAIATGSSAPDGEQSEIAFAGRSNVGKSSLMNRLLNRKNLVRTSSTPGCTRQINIFEARFAHGPVVRLVDLPGFGFAKRSKGERAQWGSLIENYLTHRDSLKFIVLLVDVRRGIEEEEKMLLDFVRQTRPDAPVHFLCVATKTDKIGRPQAAAATARIQKDAGIKTLSFSALTGEGTEPIWRSILSALPPKSA
ncbi:MAG: ribosome biogenesis GTP-binding protein YsxC [Deltaproteobacteria bacterium]|nr:ribosome biogenesis GTP-binding protein YsxC [Deltaproteobacteria bacterium]